MDTRQIQALLVYLGYDPGEVDGLPGKNTRRAVLEFQAQEDLEQDGIPGPLTQAALLEAVACGRCRQAQTSGAQTVPEWWADSRYFKREEKGIACPCGRCGGFPVWKRGMPGTSMRQFSGIFRIRTKNWLQWKKRGINQPHRMILTQ